MNETTMNGNLATKEMDDEVINILYRTVLTNTKQIGKKKFACIPRELLTVDEGYQRTATRNYAKINALARNWDHSKMDALVVVPHPEESKFYIVDGYGRFMASALLDEPLQELECDILDNVPADETERRRFEAKHFIEQNENMEPLRVSQKHNANVLLGDATCIMIQDICNKYGVEISSKLGTKIGKTLSCYAKLLQIARRVGRDGIEFAFNTIEQANWYTTPNTYCAGVIDGLTEVWRIGHDTPNFLRRFQMEMRKVDIRSIKVAAVVKYPERYSATAVKMYFQDMATDMIAKNTKIR